MFICRELICAFSFRGQRDSGIHLDLSSPWSPNRSEKSGSARFRSAQRRPKGPMMVFPLNSFWMERARSMTYAVCQRAPVRPSAMVTHGRAVVGRWERWRETVGGEKNHMCEPYIYLFIANVHIYNIYIYSLQYSSLQFYWLQGLIELA